MKVDDWVNYPRVLLVVLVILLIVAVGVAVGTSGVAFGVFNWNWDGGSELRAQADAVGAESAFARDVTKYGTVDPNGSVAVIIAPSDPYSASDTAVIREFVRDGGTVLVADDTSQPANSLLLGIGVSARLDGTRVRDERSFDASPALPIATNVTGHPVTVGVGEFALNYGTVVEPHGAAVLIGTSEFAYLDVNQNGQLDTDESLGRYPVVVIESVGAGEVIVVSDGSAFINVMLEQSGNRRFVQNLFKGHRVVIFDESHSAGPPPLVLVVLVLRDSVGLQVLVALGGLGLITVFARTPGVLGTVTGLIGQREADGGPWASEAELLEAVASRHPEWEQARVERVVKGVISRRGERERDE